ncbi:RluA family pseudouridine synthase [Desulfoferula mesophila]|uniref:Pseudouridine synthase n=1 Tax=Desulfoferula mesophila TaxID=3058419 RepID=A0AAU9EGV8_9BACT|nr:pseudouridine synthase [Desulfoferula mesophilus]
MKQHSLEIPPQADGRRLDAVLADLLGPELSRAQVQRLLKEGCITLEGRPARASAKTRAGQEVLVRLPEPEPLELAPEEQNLLVLYEDADLIVVNKAPGVVVHPAAGHSEGTLVAGLLAHCGDLSGIGGKLRPGIVHRLDKDTSGALVAAKSEAAHRGLVAAFAAGRVDKTYLALVHGRPPLSGEASGAIGRHPVDRKRMSTQARHGKAALTRWRVTRRFGHEASLLRVTIATGRTHQIRVHLSEAGFPVCGDRAYGGRRVRAGLPGQAGQALKAAGRQMLHATQLAFDHPVSGARVALTAPLPSDFRAVLRALEDEYA